jgi:hypothetical protein
MYQVKALQFNARVSLLLLNFNAFEQQLSGGAALQAG